MNPARIRRAAGFAVAVLALAGCEFPPVETAQTDFRGLGSVHLANPALLRQRVAESIPPVPTPIPPPAGVTAGQVYQNVQVLGDLDVSEFTHLMAALTQWVSPDQGCVYCHDANNFALDTPYTKIVARQMLQMTRGINGDWSSHVGETGVTCWTCHRGEPVPREVWAREVPRGAQGGMVGGLPGQNIAARQVNYSSLPFDPFTPFLMQAQSARVQTRSEEPYVNRTSIKQTEYVYAFMTHISQSLGVNCTYCHNSRSFFPWEASSPARTTAWHGIEMTRAVNLEYIIPLEPVFPANRLGPMGDVYKVNCATCHNGAYKPGFGSRLASHFPSLWQATTAPVVDGPPAASEPLPLNGAQDVLEPDVAPELGPEAIDPARPGPTVQPTPAQPPRR
jgi:photosynthetic reaction center cytochrome c subunit